MNFSWSYRSLCFPVPFHPGGGRNAMTARFTRHSQVGVNVEPTEKWAAGQSSGDFSPR